MFANDLQGYGIQKSILDFKNFRSVSERNTIPCSSSQGEPISNDLPKFLNLVSERDSSTCASDQLASNMGQTKKKKRKKSLFSPRKKRKNRNSDHDMQDTEEAINVDLAALAEEAIEKSRDSDSSASTVVLNDLPFITVGQTLEQDANQNESMCLQKEHRIDYDRNLMSTKEQNMIPLLPNQYTSSLSDLPENFPVLKRIDGINKQFLSKSSCEAPPVLIQQKKNSPLLKTLLTPESDNVDKSCSSDLSINSTVSRPNKNCNIQKTPVKRGNQNVSKNTLKGTISNLSFNESQMNCNKNSLYVPIIPTSSIDYSKLNLKQEFDKQFSSLYTASDVFGKTLLPKSPQKILTQHPKSNFVNFTNLAHTGNDKSKVALVNKPMCTYPKQMSSTFLPSDNVMVGTRGTISYDSSHKSEDGVDVRMDFEIEPEKDSSGSLIPLNLIKEEKLSDEDDPTNYNLKQISQDINKNENHTIFPSSKTLLESHPRIDANLEPENDSATEEIEENLPLSHYIQKLQSRGNIVTEVKRIDVSKTHSNKLSKNRSKIKQSNANIIKKDFQLINPQNVHPQISTFSHLLEHNPFPNATKPPKAKRKAKGSVIKSPTKRGKKYAYDLLHKNFNENNGENKSEISEFLTENSELVVMQFQEDGCYKNEESSIQNIKDLLALPNVQESAHCLSKNNNISKIEPFPMLPFIKTEPNVSACVSEMEKLPDHAKSMKDKNDHLDKPLGAPNNDFSVEQNLSNTAVSEKTTPKKSYQRKRVRKGCGKKKNKVSKLTNQPMVDDEIILKGKDGDGSASFPTEHPINDVLTENIGVSSMREESVTNQNSKEQNIEQGFTQAGDKIANLNMEDSTFNSSSSPLENAKDKPTKNQKKKRNRKKTSWYPKKRKSASRKKAAHEEVISELDLMPELPVEKAKEIAPENRETTNVTENVHNNNPTISNTKLLKEVSLETLVGNSPAKDATLNYKKNLQNKFPRESLVENIESKGPTRNTKENMKSNSVSLDQKVITSKPSTLIQKADPSDPLCVLNLSNKTNDTKLSAEQEKSEVPKKVPIQNSVSTHEFESILSSIKKEKEESPNSANCIENSSNTGQLSYQSDFSKEVSDSPYAKTTSCDSLNSINVQNLPSIKKEKNNEDIIQHEKNIYQKMTEKATTTVITNNPNAGHIANSIRCENSSVDQINKVKTQVNLNQLKQNDNAEFNKTDNLCFKQSTCSFEAVEQTINNSSNNLKCVNLSCTEKNQKAVIPAPQKFSTNENSTANNVLKQLDFAKILQSIKKEKVDDERSSKSDANSYENSGKDSANSVLDKMELNHEKMMQSSLPSNLNNINHCEKISHSIKKEIIESNVEGISNSENLNKNFSNIINTSHSLRPNLSNNKEMLQNAEVNSNCSETLSEKQVGLSDRNFSGNKDILASSESEICRNISLNQNKNACTIQIKQEIFDGEKSTASALHVPEYPRQENSSLSMQETYKCSSDTTNKVCHVSFKQEMAANYNTKQDLCGTSIVNASKGISQFQNHLIQENQNLTCDLLQTKEPFCTVQDADSCSSLSKAEVFAKDNLISNYCSPSPQYKTFYDVPDTASALVMPDLSSKDEISFNVPFYPVSTKCSEEFFKYSHPAEINITKSRPKFRNKSKIYSRVETSSMSLSVTEVSEKLHHFENYGIKSGNKLGDIVRITNYPLCKHEIECYYRIIKLAPSQKLLSMCVKSAQKAPSPLIQMNIPEILDFQNSSNVSDCQMPSKRSLACLETKELGTFQEKDNQVFASDEHFEGKALNKETNIVNQSISPFSHNYSTTENVNNETPYSTQGFSSSQSTLLMETKSPVENNAWQDIQNAIQMLKSKHNVTFENKCSSESMNQGGDDWNKKSDNFHSNIDVIIPNFDNMRTQQVHVANDTCSESDGKIKTSQQFDLSTSNDQNLSSIHKIQSLFKEVSKFFPSQFNAANEANNKALHQQSNYLDEFNKEKKFQPECYPVESYEWRRMDNSLPAVEQDNLKLAAVKPSKINEEITVNENAKCVEESCLIASSFQSAVQDVKLPLTELRKILEAANLNDSSQKQREMQTQHHDLEHQHMFSTFKEASDHSFINSDMVESSDKGGNCHFGSIQISKNTQLTNVFPNSEIQKEGSVREIGEGRSPSNDISNSNSQKLSESEDETVDNDVFVGNESCNSNSDESDAETVSLKENAAKQKKDKNANEKDSTSIPQYKSKWEKIMERKALETNNKEKSKINEHLLKDCFPVSAKVSKKKKAVDTISILPVLAEKKKKKKSKQETKKHKASKSSKKSSSSKLKKSSEISISRTTNESDISNIKPSSVSKPLKKSSAPKLAHSSNIDKFQKSPSIKVVVGPKKTEQPKLHASKSSSKEIKQKSKNILIDDASNLFAPDIAVLKTDETSRRFYGKRITNRGSFLTETRDKFSKMKPVVIKKTSNKSKHVPPIRTDEYHSIIQSPDINIHTFSRVQNSEHRGRSNNTHFSPSFLNQFNTTSSCNNSFNSFKNSSYEESQVHDFDRFHCFSPKVSPNVSQSCRSQTQSIYEEQPQNNLKTGNIFQAEESFSSLISQNYPQTHVPNAKGLKYLSNLLDFGNKNQNQLSPVAESDTFMPISPASSHTRSSSSVLDATSFEVDTKNSMTPMFSEGAKMHFSNSQHSRVNSGKCICLPPKHLKSSVGHTIIDSLNVLLLILEWNVDWLFQQQKNHDPPPISKTLHKVADKYETYEEYYNTFLPLMLLETWQRIYVSWTHLHQAHPYFCDILSYCEESNYITVECQTAYIAHDHDKSVFPEEGTVIMVKFGTKTKGGIKILGYVTSVKIRPFNAATDSKQFSNRNLKNVKDDQIHMLKLTFMGAYASDEFDRKQPIRVQVLCNIKSTLKQNDALLFVDKSPLHKNILNPLDSGLSSVTLPPRSVLKEPDRSNECVKEIIKGIVSTHPIPLLTIIKSLPSSDRLLVLPPLISKMKESYRTKVLLCTRTTKALAEIGLCLEDHQMNIVIVGKRADTHVKLRRYLLDDLAVCEVNNNPDAEDSLLKGNLQKEHIKPEVLIKAKRYILGECDVVLCLIRNSHDDLMAQTFYDNECIAHMCCIVDEANLCTEPETLIPLMYGISKLILIGDPDVPAKVCSKSAINLDYKRSLFHRAYDLDLISD